MHLSRRFLLLLAIAESLALSARAVTATGLSSFEAIEEPVLLLRLPGNALQPDPERFVNIADLGNNTIRTTLRYHAGEWWDGDRDTTNHDRGRAEVKGLGPHQRHGDTFDYTTTWRTNPGFHGSGRFCHVFQLKAINGDSGAPLVTMSIQSGPTSATVEANPDGPKIVARRFSWQPDTWQVVRIRIKTSPTDDGELSASINGDALQGATGVAMSRPEATSYRPKWGLYRSHRPEMTIGDDYVEHRNMTAQPISSTPGPVAARIENAELELAARRLAASSSPAKALAWLRGKPASSARDFAVGSLAALWAETDAPAAMGWAETLPAGALREDTVMRIFNRWADQDIATAMIWLSALAPKPELDALIWFLATDTTYRYVNRPVALQSLPLITDSELRAQAVEHVVEIWARQEREAATRYVAENPLLTAAQKQLILAKLGPRPGSP